MTIPEVPAKVRARRLLAVALAVLGVALNVLYVVGLADPLIPWLDDFARYYEASERMLAGDSPYTQAQLDGPVDAICHLCYLYPPFLAQAISPLTLLPLEAAKIAWFGLVTVLGLVSVWLATGLGGAARTFERAAWVVAATMFFFPVAHSNWLGNVGTLIMLAVVLLLYGGALGGLGIAVATLIKVVPGALAPAALLSGPRPRTGFLVGLGGIAACCFVLAPSAWLEYPTVLWNMLAGSGDTRFNLAPAVLAERAGLADFVVSAVRLTTLALGGVALVASAWLARRAGALPTAALLGVVAMLLIPGTLWYHYLSVLLPFAALAWVVTGRPARLLLLGAAAAITLAGLTWLPLALGGAALLVVVAGHSLWPRPDPVGQAGG